MPIYEYRCLACDHEFEREQRITEDAIKKCPACGKLKVRRLISSGSSFQLKGGGWYNDGYHGKPDKKSDAKSSDSGNESKGAGGTAVSKKSSDKPDAKKPSSGDSSKK
jgi:putative FmdB family regulatory protein